uniref:Uncharacterized protein AlNc14C3G413 n=1 Tax=Albugo laibachii Nc14 TaxID=890382 RepID=F0VZT4_9STRA|nr:conserved hypothetical protein [Albugo laibachii Nc14]|eukprot:CCA14305.1 conserved hypothetical protein [Albugo laibachii Nc14]
MNRNIRSETVEFIVRAAEDLVLAGKERNIVRVPANNLYSCLMQKTQRFSSLFRHYSKHHGLPRDSLEFIFTDQLDPDGSPESVFLQKNDIILVRHRPPTSSIARPLVNDDEYFSRMKELLASGENSDVVIEVGTEGASFPAHRSILSARCEFFRAMLRPGAMKESTAGVVRITNHSAEMVSKMLEFIYTNRVSDLHKLGHQQLIELLTLAEQYLLVSLRCACEAAAQELVNLQNIGKFLVAAENHNANYLKESCLQFFVEYRHEILQDDAFREEVESCPSIAFQLLKVLAQKMPVVPVAPVAVCSTTSTESSKRRRLCMPSDEEEVSREWT